MQKCVQPGNPHLEQGQAGTILTFGLGGSCSFSGALWGAIVPGRLHEACGDTRPRLMIAHAGGREEAFWCKPTLSVGQNAAYRLT